jgi:phosphatidate cytidylyltransferase
MIDYIKEIYLNNKEISIAIGLIIGILILFTTIFGVWAMLKPNNKPKELISRTRSWWVMATIFISATLIHPIITFVAFALLSFTALRELSSISKNLPKEDLPVVMFGYLCIPVQYYFAYGGYYNLFLIFIPLLMHIFIPFVLVLRGRIEGITASMTVIPTHLMLVVFAISHLAYFLSLPELEGFDAGGRGMLIFIVFVTEINDVLQFVWGKLLGKRKILPKVSPNKTWEGFLGGMVSTIVVSYFLRFLTPMGELESLVAGMIIAGIGFIGDVTVSAIKRDIGIKDTGNLIPGHGGLMDRIDSLAFTAPIFFHLMYNLHYSG